MSLMTGRRSICGVSGGGDFLHAQGNPNLILQHVHHVVVEVEMLQPQALVGTGVKNGFGCVFIVVETNKPPSPRSGLWKMG